MIADKFQNGWEQTLIQLAQEATTSKRSLPFQFERSHEDPQLQQAYRACERVTAQHSRSFHLATALLPEAKRRAVRALYAFCRIADNIVDQGSDQAEESLNNWKARTLFSHPDPADPIAFAWADARHRYRIPLRFAEQLIEGIERDLKPARYSTFADLSLYCYGVASTVGLMSMHIIGFREPEALPAAIKMGVALQMTNILRDVGEDWQAGRLYLPLEELAYFGLGEEDLAKGRVDDRWRSFMRFQIDRNRRLYAEAWPGIRKLLPDGQFSVTAAARLYQAILEDIENHDYDVFNRRAHVSDFKKLSSLFSIYREVKRSQKLETKGA